MRGRKGGNDDDAAPMLPCVSCRRGSTLVRQLIGIRAMAKGRPGSTKAAAAGSPARKRARKQEVDEDLAVPPQNWERVLGLVKDWRAAGPSAPVDTMGCERLQDPNADAKTQRFHTLVSLMLSSQTKDQVTAAAMERLHAMGLTVQNVADKFSEEEIDEAICKVGFHTTKAKRIKEAARILIEKHDGDIPDTADGLMALPGVGPKMAFICMNVAWGKPSGIGVDVHVHRITNRIGWCNDTPNPEKTRARLEAWLPVDEWIDINPLLVGFGQLLCTPRAPKCRDCPLADGLCKSAEI